LVVTIIDPLTKL